MKRARAAAIVSVMAACGSSANRGRYADKTSLVALPATPTVTARAVRALHVDLGRCTALDTPALRAAIVHELPTASPSDASAFAVIVECPDALTATLHVDPAPAAGPLARTVYVGEVPEAIRIKLLALVVGELVQQASNGGVEVMIPNLQPTPLDGTLGVNISRR